MQKDSNSTNTEDLVDASQPARKIAVAATPDRWWHRVSGKAGTRRRNPEPAATDIRGDERPIDDLPLPVIWLLGKTGAGKTSLIRAITGATEAAVGNGFEACTQTSAAYDFPPDEPVMRFLDTRGLGEARYDPAEDLAVCQAGSHVLLILARLDDPVQGAVAEALAALRKQKADMPVILLHTAGDRISGPDMRARARAVTQSSLQETWRAPIPSLDVDLSDPHDADLDKLAEKLLTVLPSVSLFMERQVARDAEEAAYLGKRNLILRYAAAAATTGAAPVIGAASIPAVQITMLASLATAYGITWNRSKLAMFGAALGGGVLGGQALGLLGRQAASFIPVIGQIVVPALSASWGFASTYALGRAAAYWMYQTRQGKPVDRKTLHERYAQAFKKTARDEAG